MPGTHDQVIEEVLAHAVVASAYATALAERLDTTAGPAEADRAYVVSEHVLAVVRLTQQLREADRPAPCILTPALPHARRCAD